ncbi:aminotransferase class I/II-fold pyridoxal phosphate-dependent enzyme [Jatrophihabitans telluris]|uniref:Aminotransferase n=1 Tax=Jatrophihabitans telluris TaxID=2038343 RepID=A0ABY4R1W6_9ACTN|nr:aminotransferase class I/II-fold pyridoxal phosphate-dependent enzyme [Jatrophihabitans telluris]UQX89798.1 aminotransferase class I/II-fold pyridoxal phosphate-dependent enzyme [Jatrophihabitans telluris]
MTRPASRRSQVAPFYVMEIFGAAEARRSAGLPVYNLAAGQPSTGAPSAVQAAAAAALVTDKIGYTAALGIPALRAAIASHTERWYGVAVSPDNVVVTTGSSGGFLAAFLACFDAGDVVAMARPGYPAYRNILASLGCVVQEFDCGPEQDYLPTVDILDALDPCPDGLILASPANPTGAMIPDAELRRIVEWCERRQVRLISDELYHGISYVGAAPTAWQYGRSSVVVNSFSKYFSMTGWRLGWLLVPEELLDAVDRIVGNYSICPPALSQLAAVAAFQAYPELDQNVARYAVNRDKLLAALPRIGLPDFAPADGAFYVYADVSAYTDDSLSWVRRVLRETGVALAPGLDFDTTSGGHFARLSFAGETAEIDEAIDVLGSFLAR